MKEKEVPYVAFIDDSGSPELDFSTEHIQQSFIITAVVVKLDQLETVRKKTDAIRTASFQTGEMKSDRLTDPIKRLQILQRLHGLPIQFYSIVVDKARIWPDSGLKYKGSFVRFFTNALTFSLHKAYPSLAMVADEFGRDRFMEGVRDFMAKRYPADLMFQSEFGDTPKFQFKDSKSEVLLQVADLISGTLLRCYDPRKKEPEAGQYLTVLEKKKLRIDFWPPRIADGDDGFAIDDGQFDDLIYHYCLGQATDFIYNNVGTKDEDVQLQVAVLEFLLHSGDRTYVYSDTIVRGLLRQGFLRGIKHSTKLVPRRRRTISRAIAKLRDKDVIVASSESGYKLPSCKADLHSFVLSTQAKAAPMTGRVSHARNQILAMSKGKLDILAPLDLIEMRALVESLATLNHPVDVSALIPKRDNLANKVSVPTVPSGKPSPFDRN